MARFFLLDDDLVFYRRVPGDPAHSRVIDDLKMTRYMFGVLYAALGNFGHVAVSEKLGNNRFKEEWRFCTRGIRCVGYNHAKIQFNKLKFGRLVCMSDYDMTLQLLRQGVKNAVWFRYSQCQPGSNTAGGCSAYRTPEVLAQSARNLAKFHPGLVRLTEKETKGGWFKGQTEINKRLDVVISWK